MTSLSFGPEDIDIQAYAGDSFKTSFKILSHNDSTYSTTGSWKINFYNKLSASVIDTDPTGISISPVGNGFKKSIFSYTASNNNQVLFFGSDDNSNNMSYIVGTTNLYKNDTPINSNHYTASNRFTIAISTPAALNDVIRVECLSTNTADGVTEVSVSNELTELLSNSSSVIYDFYLDNGIDKYTFIKGNVSFRSIDS